MFTKSQAKEFNLSYQAEVRFLSRMSKQGLQRVHARNMNELGMQMLYGGPASKDELITAILDMHGMGIAKLNEATHVLYHSSECPNEACNFCQEA